MCKIMKNKEGHPRRTRKDIPEEQGRTPKKNKEGHQRRTRKDTQEEQGRTPKKNKEGHPRRTMFKPPFHKYINIIAHVSNL